MRYDYTRLLVTDFPACFRFYRDVIGLAPRLCIVFGVDDVDATQRRLEAAGVPIHVGATDRAAWEVRTLHVRDPDGRLVELNAPLG